MMITTTRRRQRRRRRRRGRSWMMTTLMLTPSPAGRWPLALLPQLQLSSQLREQLSLHGGGDMHPHISYFLIQ